MRRIKISMLAGLILSIPFSIILAGECMDTEENFLDAIAAADPKSENPGVGWEISCLYHSTYYMVVDFGGFAKPEEIEDIDRWSEQYRERVFEVLPPFLESPDAFIRCATAKALAYYKWPESYEYLVKCDVDMQIVTIAAIVGDKRAVSWIIERYKYFNRKYRSRPRFSYDDKINCLGALYHLGTPEIIPFLDEIIANPKPENIKPVAEHVLSRIHELYPEANKKRSNGE